jgi:hypothetical protein
VAGHPLAGDGWHWLALASETMRQGRWGISGLFRAVREDFPKELLART